ncbi:MAG: type II toxin-antitoxin system antitoxin SocA domain-containing protein [Campylobacterota bacterium]
MNIDMTKIANVILYMLHKQTKHLNDKKVSIMLFLMDYNHQKFCGDKIFKDEYIKLARQPQSVILGELFDIIANNEDLDEDDARLFLIQELLEFIDIEVLNKKKFIELKFLKVDEEFDESLFSADELKTIHKIVSTYLETTPRNIANDCFKLEEVRETPKRGVII